MDAILEQLLSWLRSVTDTAGDVIAVVQSVDPGLRALVAGVAALLETNIITGLFVPGDTVVLVTASAVSSPVEGIILGLCVAVGAFIGEVTGYALGYRLGSRRKAVGQRGPAAAGRLESASRVLLRYGGPAILGARFVPVLRTVMPFAVGISGYRFARFVAWSAPSCVLWSAVFVTIYALAAAPARDGTGSLLASAALIGLGILLFAASSVAQHLVQRGTAAGEQSAPL